MKKRSYLKLSEREKNVVHALSMMCTEVTMRSRHAKEWAELHNSFLGRYTAAVLSRKYRDQKRGAAVPTESEMLRRLLAEEELIDRVLS